MMTIKRSYSDSPSPSVSPSIKEEILNHTPTKKRKTSSPASSSKSPKKPCSPENGTWTPEKKARFMDEVIAAGYKAINLDALAAELGMSKRQLVDQLVPNRSNLRGKAVKFVKGES